MKRTRPNCRETYGLLPWSGIPGLIDSISGIACILVLTLTFICGTSAAAIGSDPAAADPTPAPAERDSVSSLRNSGLPYYYGNGFLLVPGTHGTSTAPLRARRDQYVVHHWPDPVNVRNGNLVLYFQDIHVPYLGVSLDIARVFNSRSNKAGSFGYGWSASFEMKLLKVTPETLEILESDGSTSSYQRQAKSKNGSPYRSPTGRSRVERDPLTGTCTRFLGCDRQDVFNADGTLAAVKDRQGNGVTFTWSGGLLRCITDGAGRRIEMSYNGQGLVKTVRDPAGRMTHYEYDHSGNLTKTTAPGGASYQFGYDRRHNLVKMAHPDKGVTEMRYDDNGRVIGEYGPGKKKTLYAYTIQSRQPLKFTTTVTNALGNKTQYVYETRQSSTRLTIIDPLGSKTVKDFDRQGNLTKVTDPLGRITLFEYDSYSRLLRVIDSGGASAKRAYSGVCGSGALASFTDPMGATVKYGSHSGSNTRLTIDALGNETKMMYDDRGLLVQSMDPLGHVTRFTRDKFGNITTIVDARGKITKIKYDVLGRITETTDPGGGATRFDYNDAGKISRITAPLGLTKAIQYDAAGRIVSRTDSAGFRKQFKFDVAGNLVRETDEENGSVEYTYDPVGNLISSKDPSGAVMSYAYDAAGRPHRLPTLCGEPPVSNMMLQAITLSSSILWGGP